MKNKGYTLVELLAVIVILGIILVLAVPSITNSINFSRKEAFVKSEEELARAAENYIVNNPKYIPRNIGDTKEVKLSDLLDAKVINTIVNPENNKQYCNGYVLVTKIADRKYAYVPHLNCEKNIGSSADDGLVAHYTFDDYQEPTQNVVINGDFSNGLNNWDCTMGGTGMNNYCEIKYENDEPYLHVHWERVSGSGNAWPLLRNSVTYTTAGVPYSLSCKIRINAQSGTTAEVRHSAVGNDYWTSGRKIWGFGGRTLGVWQDVTLTRTFDANYTNSSGTVYPLSAVFELYSGNLDIPGEYVDFDIKLIQIEQKDHSSAFVNGSRTGVITDYSLNKNNITLPLDSAPRWVSDSAAGEGAYQFNGVNSYIGIPNFNYNVLKQGQENASWTISTWVKLSGTQSGNERVIAGRSGCHGGIYAFPSDLYFAIKTDQCWTNAKSILFTPPNMNDWEYLVAVYNNRNMSFYANGKLVSTDSFTATSHPYSDAFYIGGIPNFLFKGTIDDVKIYTRPLTAAEIKHNYDILLHKMGK